jgi:DNA mismatch repair protein MutS
MQFKTDEQTMLDLSITASLKHRSVAGLFKPVTKGGQLMLIQFLNHPLNNADLLQQRLSAIKYLDEYKVPFVLNKEELDFIEHYLNQGNRPEYVSTIRAVKNAIKYSIRPSNYRYIIERGIKLLIKLINYLDRTLNNRQQHNMPEMLIGFGKLISTILKDNSIIKDLDGSNKPTLKDVEVCDYLFRNKAHEQVKGVLSIAYQLDVYTAAAQAVADYKLSYPVIIEDEKEATLELEGVFHPLVTQPVSNNIYFNNKTNLCFLTGANMAGKSTLLKSIGIAVCLAHVGFPVPASAMKTTVFNGIFTTINLSDNINEGHSHFYAEVLRIKEVAKNVGDLKKIVVIFDELFRGTNVKDAYDASLYIIKALAQVKNCVFVISTHIIEVGEELKEIDNVFFKCLNTTLKGTEPVYDCKLRDGISAERLGMKIIEEEGILEILFNSMYNS